MGGEVFDQGVTWIGPEDAWSIPKDLPQQTFVFRALFHWFTSWKEKKEPASRPNDVLETVNERVDKDFINTFPQTIDLLSDVYQVVMDKTKYGPKIIQQKIREEIRSHSSFIVMVIYRNIGQRHMAPPRYYGVIIKGATIVMFNPTCLGEKNIELGIADQDISKICTEPSEQTRFKYAKIHEINISDAASTKSPEAGDRARSRSPVDIGRGAQAEAMGQFNLEELLDENGKLIEY